MRYLPVVMLLALAAGCSADRPAAESDSASSSSSSSPSSPSSTDPADTPACGEVRAGVDAFNAGDYQKTVDHFVAAVPLAEDQLNGSQEADDLLEAVKWYAELPPEDYLEASRSAPEFARYKVITLTQCVPGDGASESPGQRI